MLVPVLEEMTEVRKSVGGRFLMLDCGGHMVPY